jgi:Icc-related predicted phosphoesterase
VKLQIASDLHLSFWGTRHGVNWFTRFLDEIQTDADVLVLAGDIVDFRPGSYRWSIARLKDFAARYPHVVYVPGNHEFYGWKIDDVHLQNAAEEAGIDILEPGVTAIIDGHRFRGGTMFQPKPLEGYDPMPNPISDHWCIQDFDTEPQSHYYALKSYFETDLREGDIVVTHHAPSNGSLAEEWRGNLCNWWFITPQIEPLLLEKKPALWFHGHVHTPFDYRLGDTRVVCNPMGYPDEGVLFEHKKVVEI